MLPRSFVPPQPLHQGSYQPLLVHLGVATSSVLAVGFCSRSSFLEYENNDEVNSVRYHLTVLGMSAVDRVRKGSGAGAALRRSSLLLC